MLVYLIADSGIFSLDATQSFSLDFSNDVTNYPIESGFDVTKGINAKSDTFSITGVISDHHLRNSADFRSDRVVAELKELKESRQLVTLVAKNLSFDNLAIISINAQESATSGNAKTVTINLQQVRIASSSSTTIPRDARPDVADKSDPKANEGVQSKEKTDEEKAEERRTIINNLGEAILNRGPIAPPDI